MVIRRNVQNNGVFFICFFFLIISGCNESVDTGNAVAQVGKTFLTTDELKKNFPVEYEHIISQEQYLDFIKRWIDEEILLQEAMKQKIHLDSEIKTKIREQRKKIIVEEFLIRESKDFSYVPDEEAIRQYYESYQEAFFRREPEIKYADLIVQSLKSAWQIREKVTSSNFLVMMRSHSIGGVPESFDELPYKRINEIDTCISSAAFSTRVGGTTRPIRCGDKYHMVHIIDKKGPNTLRPLAEVKQEIANILINRKQKEHLEMKIQELKSGVFFTYNLDLIPGSQESEKLDTINGEMD